MCQRRGRDHTLERRNNVCACKFATARSNRRRRRRQRCGKDCARGGGDRRQSERDRWSVTKTKRQCTKFPDRVPGMGETVDDHRQPGNPSILYSVFWTVANPPCSDFHPSHHHVHPMRRKVAYVACLDHYGLWMGSSFDAPSNRHFSLFILGQKFHHWMAIFALAPPRVWFCNKHSTIHMHLGKPFSKLLLMATSLDTPASTPSKLMQDSCVRQYTSCKAVVHYQEARRNAKKCFSRGSGSHCGRGEDRILRRKL